MISIIKKELKSYLLSPIGYIFIGLFLLIFSIFFYLNIFQSQVLNFEYLFYNGATILTFVTPVLTMRMFAEERKNGTEQLLLTSPRSITSIVLGKFIIFLYIKIFWKTIISCCRKHIAWIFLIEFSLYIFWYVCFKYNRKSNNCFSTYNWCIYGNVVFTRYNFSI